MARLHAKCALQPWVPAFAGMTIFVLMIIALVVMLAKASIQGCRTPAIPKISVLKSKTGLQSQLSGLDFRRLIGYVAPPFATTRREAYMMRVYLPFYPGGIGR